MISFFLDYKKIGKGKCYYIDAGVPHAYIHGECLEIMKNSDNVCRLGLTPKLKDIKVIQDVLGEDNEKCQPIQLNGSEANQTHRFNQKIYEN